MAARRLGVYLPSFLLVLEGSFPLFRFTNNRLRHGGINLVFLTTTTIINGLFGMATVGMATVGVFFWLQREEFGLLYWFELPVWVELLIAVLVFELIAQCFVHCLLHRVSIVGRHRLPVQASVQSKHQHRGGAGVSIHAQEAESH